MAEALKAPSTTSEESFDFIETPAAPSPAPETRNYGVRTTSVCFNRSTPDVHFHR